MEKLSRTLSLLVLLLVFPVSFAVAGTGDESQALVMDTLVVTGESGQPDYRTGDVDLSQTTAHVTVIKREQFEGKVKDLAQVLKDQVGVQVRQTGGLGSYATVSLRGSSSDQVLVYLDGVLLNSAAGGGVDLSTIALSDVEAIEIYRGVTPINFGKASIGGVINIRTLRTKTGLTGNVAAGYGSFSTRKFSAFINHKPGKWDYLLSTGYLASKNNFRFLNDNGTEWNPDDDRRENRNNARFEQKNILGRFGYDIRSDLRVDVTNQWFSKTQGLPSWDNNAKTRTSYEIDRNITTVSLTADDLGARHVNTRIILDYSVKDETYDDSKGQVGLGYQKTKYHTDRWGGNCYGEWLGDWNQLSLLFDYHRQAYDSEDLLEHRNPAKATRDTVSVGLSDVVFLFNDRLIISPAVRYILFHNDLKDGTGIWGQPLPPNSDTEDYWNPQVGIRYRPWAPLTLKMNVAQYVREPTFYELFGDRGYIVGNPDLKAETGLNVDVGFDLDKSFDCRWINHVSLGAAYFHNSVNDLIAFVYDARGVGKAMNIAEAHINGVEATGSVQLLDHFKLIGNLTWQDPVNESRDPMFDGKRLPGRFETSYLGRLEITYGNVKVYGEYSLESGIYYDSANLLDAEDKEIVNAGVSYLYQPFLFSLEAKNLTDDQYEDFNGYPMPGRSVYVTVSLRY